MRTNGFTLSRGPDARGRAEKAAARVARQNKTIQFSSDSGGATAAERSGGGGGSTCFVAYSLEEDGERFPLVHGFTEGRENIDREAHGEFAFVTEEEDGRILAGRDPLGTRALYVDEGRSVRRQRPPLLPAETYAAPGGGQDRHGIRGAADGTGGRVA